MKTCNKCKVTVTLDEAKKTFVPHKGCLDGIRPMCIKCKRAEEKANRLRLRSSEDFKIKERTWNRNRRARYYKDNVEAIRNYLGGEIACTKCGYTSDCFAPFDFHHLDPSTKEFGIHKKIDISPFIKWKEELNKCILVCSNCHRKIHSKRCQND